MGILSRSLGIRAFSVEDPSQPLLPSGAMMESLGLGRSDAGVLVNTKQALRLSPVFACFKIISEDLSKIPLSVFKRYPDGSVTLAAHHPVHELIHDEPNDFMTAMTFRGALITSALAHGNGYALIVRDQGAKPIALHLMPSEKTSAVFVDGEFGFATTATPTGAPKWIPKENVLHIVGLSFDGVIGHSPVTTCKNAIGIGLAAEKYQALFFGNGARASGVLTHPDHLEAEAYENLRKSVREWATGDNAHRPVILEEGMKWEQITVNPNDGQVLESRKFQVEEVARLYRVPLHKLGELTRSTMNNIEHQGIEHIQDALQPWAVRLEQEVNRKLLSGNYFCEHDFAELARGDSASTATGIQTLRNIGVISTNDARLQLRMNPISKADGGDIRIVQGANVPLTAMVNYVAPTGPGGGGESPDKEEADDELGELPPDKNAAARTQIMVSHRRLIRDAVGRSVHRQYDPKFVRAVLLPIFTSMREALNVVRFGSGTLTKDDAVRIAVLVSNAAAMAADWTRENASETATRLTADACAALEKD